MAQLEVKFKIHKGLAVAIAVAAVALLAVLLALAARGCQAVTAAPEVIDPHAGQVQVNDGVGLVWITPAEGAAVSGLTAEDFTADEETGWPVYTGEEFTALRGIDVADFQKNIDWAAVKAAGIDFAIIRCGYRGYEQGTLNPDSEFAASIEGAKAAGLQVGAYYFSQATTPDEAAQEALHALTLCYGYALDLPIYWDWERLTGVDARANHVAMEDLTDIAVAFCTTIEKNGYEAGIYFNRQLGYYAYDWTRLADYEAWVADYNSYPDFYYRTDVWQYSPGAEVPGVDIITDMNLRFVPKEKAAAPGE